VGVANIVFSTDFPHPDCKYPGAVARFLELPQPDAAKRAILWDNCARYYGLA
jgi:predicted TIM-barrel fold metal-dependent hydrolase